MSGEAGWVDVCPADRLGVGDAVAFDWQDHSFAIYRTASGYFATDGTCTHEEADLTEGLVLGDVIECPLHQGRFHIPSGRALGAPVCVNLRIYKVRLASGRLLICVG
ncbi:MAG TPA: non-heme iron oxygenase ferredoxin subunit [Acetobacteraceae bacterium]|nr:non-heme iron oxygenase ferredoxin subunit [Acetobacteraceae bacterium]